MNAEIPQKPFLLVIDPTQTFPSILKVALRREGYEVEMVAFQQPDMAIFWLSGEMDQRKAVKYPLASPWDHYPALRRPMIAIVSLDFSSAQLKRMMAFLFHPEPRPHLFTTATRRGFFACWKRKRWSSSLPHIQRPLKVDDVHTLLIPFFQQ